MLWRAFIRSVFEHDVHSFEDEIKPYFSTFTHSKTELRAAHPREPTKNTKIFCGDPKRSQAAVPSLERRGAPRDLAS